MKELLVRNLFMPLASRVGTAAAMWIIALGVDSDLTNRFIEAVLAAVLIGIDLLFSAKNRKAGIE